METKKEKVPKTVQEKVLFRLSVVVITVLGVILLYCSIATFGVVDAPYEEKGIEEVAQAHA